MEKIIISIRKTNYELIGYKADTGWTLVNNPKSAKIHTMIAGAIPEVLINNLAFIMSTHGEDWLKHKGLNRYDVFYICYRDAKVPDSKPIVSHLLLPEFNKVIKLEV